MSWRCSRRLKPGIAATVAERQLTSIDTKLAKENPHSGYDGGIVAAPARPTTSSDPHRLDPLPSARRGRPRAADRLRQHRQPAARARQRAPRGNCDPRRARRHEERIVAQMLVESLLLSIGGGMLGIVVAEAGMQFLVSSPAQIPRLQNAELNAPVMIFALALAVACAVLFGLMPALARGARRPSANAQRRRT